MFRGIPRIFLHPNLFGCARHRFESLPPRYVGNPHHAKNRFGRLSSLGSPILAWYVSLPSASLALKVYPPDSSSMNSIAVSEFGWPRAHPPASRREFSSLVLNFDYMVVTEFAYIIADTAVLSSL